MNALVRMCDLCSTAVDSLASSSSKCLLDDAVNHQGDSREYQCYQNGRGGSVVEGYAVAQAHGFSGDRMM